MVSKSVGQDIRPPYKTPVKMRYIMSTSFLRMFEPTLSKSGLSLVLFILVALVPFLLPARVCMYVGYVVCL
jgi:hypothetical protein